MHVPTLIWSYALPPDLDYIEREVVLNLTVQWCNQHTSIKWHVLSICEDIFEERKPLLKLPNPTDKMPMLSSSEPGFTEIGISVNIKHKPQHLLANPTNGQLSYLHAQEKDSLDRYILSGILQNLLERGINSPVRIATRIQAICPPGSHTFMHVPALQNLYYRPGMVWNVTRDPLNEKTPLAYKSAGVLVPWSLICHPCPDGQAPRTPYSFDGCHYCPRGYYLGGTGWPSSAGCLRCPKGYSTDRVGATSKDDCMLDAGAVTRTGFGYLLDFWFKLKQSMVGVPGPETNTRALRKDQQSAWAWLGRTGATLWIWSALYTLFVASIIALATYRLHLYYKLKSIFKKRYDLLLKIAIIGQINLISRIKQQRKLKGLE
ncbi:unnamed protein product [Calicophoron daubneyi]|uniref:Tyrosine-protein kinase ephrin type A/B receptor-like domain-containing protein n=1 Tax=Calicophoron daubneyi TaxID=300641 RepID=A0AAV2TIR8_CALDB